MHQEVGAAFSGKTFDKERDGKRLGPQLTSVKMLMADGQWRTLDMINRHVHGTAASLSARLRDLRKKRFGSHTVDARYRERGIWEYRLVLNRPDAEAR